MRSFDHFIKDSKGAVTIEFTVLVPAFVLLMVFFADTSIDFTQDTAENAVRFQMSTRFVPLSAPPEPDSGDEAVAGGGR